MVRTITAVIATTLLLTIAAPTSAAIITITDLTDGPPTVTYSGFPSGPDAARDCTAGPESLNCESSYLEGTSNPTNIQSGEFEIVLFEDQSRTIVSDTFLITRGIFLNQVTFFVEFLSDSDGVPIDLGGTPVDISAVETGGPQLFTLPRLCSACIPLIISLNSDVDPTATTPAPATLALVGLALAGLGFSRRKQA